MVQLDYEEELAPLHGMYGLREAELEDGIPLPSQEGYRTHPTRTVVDHLENA